MDENGTVEFEVLEELYSAEELSPERPLVIGLVFPGTIPCRGIAYVDEQGTTKYYTLTQSGVDGSPVLEEFSLAP